MRKKFTIAYFPSAVAFLWLASIVGCGSDGPAIGRVTGTVTLDSQPLPDATVSFYPDQGRESNARTDENGRYELYYTRDIAGALVGQHTVRISTSTEKKPKERLPARYNTQSELKEEVKKGSNAIDFDLQSP